MFCDKCGNKLDEGMQFCPKCGNQVNKESENDYGVSGGMLTIERKMGFFYAGMIVVVRIDGDKKYKIKNGNTIQVPLENGVHTIEAGYGADYRFSCQVNIPQTGRLNVNIAKPSGQLSLLMDGQEAPVALTSGEVFKGLAGKMAGAVVSAAKSASESISENIDKAVGPTDFKAPENGVNEPEGYQNIGTHIEIVSMPSVNGLDAKRPYIILTVDKKYPYFFNDAEKINIPVEPGQHTVSFRTRESKGEIVINVKNVAYALIKTAVSMKVAVSRTIEQVASLDELKPFYALSKNGEQYQDEILHYVEKFGLTKNIVGLVYSDKLVIIEEDGSQDEIKYYNQYKVDVTGAEEVTFTDVGGNTKAVKLPILGVIRDEVAKMIKEINADNPDYIRKKAEDDEIERRDRTYKLKYGHDEKIFVSEELSRYRVINKKGVVIREGNLSSIISYELYAPDMNQQSVVGEAMLGGYMGGRNGAALSAINASNNNKKIKTFQVWLSVKKGSDIDVIKVSFSTSEVFKNSAMHKNLLTEYSRFDTYMKNRMSKGASSIPSANTSPVAVDTTEELRKYKQLCEDGIITQEDFDAKKKQLLGL